MAIDRELKLLVFFESKSIVTLMFFDSNTCANTKLVNPLPIKQTFINKFNFNNKY